MKRSKKKARGNPLKGISEPMRVIEIHASRVIKNKSLGFARDRARAYGDPVPPVNWP